MSPQQEVNQEQCARWLETLDNKQVEDQCSVGYSSAPSTTYSVGSGRADAQSVGDAEFYVLDSVNCLTAIDDEGFFGEDDDDAFLPAKAVHSDSLDIDDVKPSPDFWACHSGSVKNITARTHRRPSRRGCFSLDRRQLAAVERLHIADAFGKTEEEEHIYEEIPDDLPCSEEVRMINLPPPLPPRQLDRRQIVYRKHIRSWRY